MDELNCLNFGDLISIQGNCMQTEQFVISLMQGILDRNDGYVLLLQKRNFDYFTGSIFNEYSATSDNALVKDRISKDRILPRGSPKRISTDTCSAAAGCYGTCFPGTCCGTSSSPETKPAPPMTARTSRRRCIMSRMKRTA